MEALTFCPCPHLAWKQAVLRLLVVGEIENLVVEFAVDCLGHSVFEDKIDAVMTREHSPSLSEVKNTVFPERIAFNSVNREDFYRRYVRLYPSILKYKANLQGTYFGRIIGYDRERRLTSGVNQLERVIRELSRPNGLRHGAEVTLVVPEKDAHPMGFPCLSHMSFHRSGGDSVQLTALYRNHYFIKRALGNYLALTGLLRFVAAQAGRTAGRVTVVSAAAKLDSSRRLARELVGLIE